jgi:hypothetical protein
MRRTKVLLARGSAALVATAGVLLIASGAANASYLDGCQVPQVTLYAAAGLAQGFGSAYCASNVSSMEVEVDLYEYWISTSSWHLEDASTAGPVSVGSGRNLIAPAATAGCNTTDQRDWKVIATGYGTINGVLWSDQKSTEETLDCRD